MSRLFAAALLLTVLAAVQPEPRRVVVAEVTDSMDGSGVIFPPDVHDAISIRPPVTPDPIAQLIATLRRVL